MIGTVLRERYEIQSLIGRGGMGNVYLAFDRQLNVPVALKHLKPEYISDNPDIVERFRREADILRELDHPNIVNIREALFEGDSYYIIMDYVASGSLDVLIAQVAPLPIQRVLEIGLGIADALTRAHHMKVIHRDIKPANILLDDHGAPLLTDFGVAHIGGRTRMTEVGSVIGTYAYLSPEACDGEEPDERADIWSFGVVLFELVTGRRPFLGDKPATVITQILVDDIPDIAELRPDAPLALVQLIQNMLQKDPSKRISSARRIGTELEEIMQGTAVSPSKSRFSTPTPAKPADDDHTIAIPSTPPNVTPPNTNNNTANNATATTIVLPLNNVRIIAGLIVAGLVVILAIVLVVSSNIDTTTDNNEGPNADQNRAAISYVGEPVPAGNLLILVAELEAIDTESRNYTRFIADDLSQRLEASANSNQLSVRVYPTIITSASEAQAAAEANNAAVIVWGFYTEAFIQAEIHVGSLEPFPYNEFDGEELGRIANVRTRMTDVFDQSLYYYVVNTISTLYAADGDAFKSLQLSDLSVQQIDENTYNEIPPASGDSIAAILAEGVTQFFVNESTDVEVALELYTQAIQIDPSPLLYAQRSLIYLQTGDIERARDDIATAERLGPRSWTMPRYIRLAVEHDDDETLAIISSIIEDRPTDWYAYTTRGSLYYFSGNFEEARADLETAISLDPPVNFPYTYITMLNIRDGRFFDMVDNMQTIVRRFPDPTYNERLLAATFGASPLPDQDIIIASITNLALGQYQAVLNTSQILTDQEPLDIASLSDGARLVTADLYFTRGLAFCNLSRYAEAQDAYSRAIELDPSVLMFYLSRLEVAFFVGDFSQAQADAITLQTAPDIHPQLESAIIAAQREELSCKNFFSYQRETSTVPES